MDSPFSKVVLWSLDSVLPSVLNKLMKLAFKALYDFDLSSASLVFLLT